MSLAVTAMMPPRLNLQIVRIPANRKSQVPVVFSSLNCNQLLQVHFAVVLYRRAGHLHLRGEVVKSQHTLTVQCLK